MPLVALPIALNSFSRSPSLTQPLVELLSPAVSTLFFFFECTAHTMRPGFYLLAAIHLPCAFWPPEGLEHWLIHLTKVFSIHASSTPGIGKPEFTDIEEGD